MNSINLLFGPKLPPQLETVGLAFIAAPTMAPDSAIATLSAERYAKENYNHIENHSVFNEGEVGKTLSVSFSIPSVSSFSNPDALGSANYSSVVDLTTNEWAVDLLNTTIKVIGMHISKANTWCPIVQPGVIYRPYEVKYDREPTDSWLYNAFFASSSSTGTVHTLLIYSVPEYRYGTEVTSLNLSFPNDGYFRSSKEFSLPAGPHKISYFGNVYKITEVKINGSVQFTGSYTGVESDPFLKGINKTLKTIDVSKAIGPNDLIELTYLTYSDHYTYSGYRDALGNWYPFDANPEWGHLMGDPSTNTYRNSSDMLLEQITLYAIPSACIEISFTPSTGESVGTLQLRVQRACNFGETHFVRHIVSSETTEQLNARDSATVINSWGYATFGRNFYDELNQEGGDIFNTEVPSMLPLGRLVLAAPAAVRSVAVADIRQRGGGVPIDFPMVGVETQQDGLDTLRGFLDLGIWEGKAVKEGGVIEIEIDTSLLKTDPNEVDPTKFTASEIYELVKKQVPPGIDFEIKYVEF